MTSVIPLGSYARHVQTLRTLSTAQERVDTLSQQLATGKKSVDLKGFGPDSERLLKLRTELVTRQAYMTAIDTASPRIKAADLVLDRLSSVATDLTSQALIPSNPGTVRVSRPVDRDDDTMAITVNADRSQFNVAAKFTVTAVPSSSTENTYDITVHDGLGGRSSVSVNMDLIPPGDGFQHKFTITGGPGDGAVVDLTFDTLQGAGTSSFDVDWPDLAPLRERVKAYLNEVQNLLNERVGDRYLFSGSRYDTEPVDDLLGAKQVTRITLDGDIGQAGDSYEVIVDGRSFIYTTTGNEPSISAVASAIAAQLESANPALTPIIDDHNGVITLYAPDNSTKFDVETALIPGPDVINTLSAVAGPSTTQVQFGPAGVTNVEIGDRFTVKVTIGDPDDPFNNQYYLENPTAPRDRPPYQEFEVSYTVTSDDFLPPNSINSVTAVAGQLATLVNGASPAFPVTATASASSGLITLTPTDPTVPFTTEPSVANGKLINTMTVADLPPDYGTLTDGTVTEEPHLPFYDSEYGTVVNRETAWDKASVTIDDSLKIQYGIVSNDPAFQKLIQGMRTTLAAVEHPGTYTETIDLALDFLTRAKDSINAIVAKNASDLATTNITRDAHHAARSALTDQIAGIEGIDPTEVAAKLSTATNNLEAVYTVTARTQQLRLINFIA